MAITNATRVADFGSGIGTEGAVLQVDNTNNRLGVGTTNPQAMLQVGTGVSVYGNSGIVSATSFYGDGANLANVGVDTSTLVSDQVFVVGVATVGSAVTINSTGIDAVSGVITASSFVGNVTGNLTGQASALSGSRTIGGVVFDNTGNINLPGVNQSGTQNTSGTAGGLSGTPDITVGAITASNVNVSGITTVGILTAYESITVKVGTGSTELTTALSAKASTGKAIAMAMVFG